MDVGLPHIAGSIAIAATIIVVVAVFAKDRNDLRKQYWNLVATIAQIVLANLGLSPYILIALLLGCVAYSIQHQPASSPRHNAGPQTTSSDSRTVGDIGPTVRRIGSGKGLTQEDKARVAELPVSLDASVPVIYSSLPNHGIKVENRSPINLRSVVGDRPCGHPRLFSTSWRLAPTTEMSRAAYVCGNGVDFAVSKRSDFLWLHIWLPTPAPGMLTIRVYDKRDPRIFVEPLVIIPTPVRGANSYPFNENLLFALQNGGRLEVLLDDRVLGEARLEGSLRAIMALQH